MKQLLLTIAAVGLVGFGPSVNIYNAAGDGNIVAMNEKTMRVATSAGAIQVALEPDAHFQVDGLPADLKAVVKKGGEVVIYPKRGRTIIAFTPTQTK